VTIAVLATAASFMLHQEAVGMRREVAVGNYAEEPQRLPGTLTAQHLAEAGFGGQIDQLLEEFCEVSKP
jgi:hypothetical protein